MLQILDKIYICLQIQVLALNSIDNKILRGYMKDFFKFIRSSRTYVFIIVSFLNLFNWGYVNADNYSIANQNSNVVKGFSVDEQTGALLYVYKVACLHNDKVRGPKKCIFLRYNSSDNQNLDGLGEGWSWSLPYRYRYRNENMIRLSDGSTYIMKRHSHVPDQWSALLYKRERDMSITYKSDGGVEIYHKNGHKEYVYNEKEGTPRICNKIGECIDISYNNDHDIQINNTTVLPNIRITKASSDTFSIQTSYKNSSENYKTEIKLDNHGRVKRITPAIDEAGAPIIGTRAPINFEYTTYKTKKLIDSISYPKSTKARFEYGAIKQDDEGGFAIVVSNSSISHLITRQSEETLEKIDYCYGGTKDGEANSCREVCIRSNRQHNYTGYQHGNNRVSNGRYRDPLFESTNSYEYVTRKHIYNPEWSNRAKQIQKVVVRYFNKFHLLKAKYECVRKDPNQNLVDKRRHSYTYLSSVEDSLNYRTLPSNYKFPIKTIVAYPVDGKNDLKRLIQQASYDDYGNQLSFIDVMKRKKTMEYMKDATKTFMKHPSTIKYYTTTSDNDWFLKQKNAYRLLSKGSYKYYVKGMSRYLLPDNSNSNGGIVFKNKEFEYYQEDEDEFWGYLHRTTVTSSVPGNSSSSSSVYTYSYSNNLLRIAKEVGNSNPPEIYEKELPLGHSYDKIISTEITGGIKKKFEYYPGPNKYIKSFSMTNYGNSDQTKRYFHVQNQSEYYSIVYIHNFAKKIEKDYKGRPIEISVASRDTEAWPQDGSGWEQIDFKRIKRYKYDHRGRKVEEIVYNSNPVSGEYTMRTIYKYDALGKLIKKIDPFGIITYYIHTIEQDPSKSVNFNFVLTTCQRYADINTSNPCVDSSKKGSSEPYPYIHKQKTRFNDEREIISQISYNESNSQGYKVSNSYDKHGRIKKISTNDNSVSFDYDLLNNRITMNDHTGDNQIRYTYDSLWTSDNKLLFIENKKMTKIEKSYKVNNQPKKYALIGERRFDELGRVVEEFNFKHKLLTKTYGSKGLIKTIQDPLNKTISYEYRNGLINTVKYSHGSQESEISYTHNDSNLVESVFDENSSMNYRYNPDGTVSKITYNRDGKNAYVLNYQYDLQGNIFSILDSDNYKRTYLRDERDRINRVCAQKIGSASQDPSSVECGLYGSLYMKYEFDHYTRFKNISYIDGIKTSYGYDRQSKIKYLKHSQDGQDLEEYYIYYNQDDLIEYFHIIKPDIYEGSKHIRYERYEYDQHRRLNYASCYGGNCKNRGGEDYSLHYEFDKWSNLTKVYQCLHNNYAGDFTSCPLVIDYNYSEVNNIDNEGYPINENGERVDPMQLSSFIRYLPNSENSRKHCFQYNDKKQLTRESIYTGSDSDCIVSSSSNNEMHHYDYFYNVRDKLQTIVKKHHEEVLEKSQYYYDTSGLNISYEHINGDNTIQYSQSTYYHGNNPIKQIRNGQNWLIFSDPYQQKPSAYQWIELKEEEVNNKPERLIRFYSPKNNVSGEKITDGPLARYSYDPYGKQYVESRSSDNREEYGKLGWQNNPTDRVSEAMPVGNGHRFLISSHSHFTQYDSQSPFGKGGFNGYSYPLDPINTRDRNGGSMSHNHLPSETMQDQKKLEGSEKYDERVNLAVGIFLIAVGIFGGGLEIFDLVFNTSTSIEAEELEAAKLAFSRASAFNDRSVTVTVKVSPIQAQAEVASLSDSVESFISDMINVDRYTEVEAKRPLIESGFSKEEFIQNRLKNISGLGRKRAKHVFKKLVSLFTNHSLQAVFGGQSIAGYRLSRDQRKFSDDQQRGASINAHRAFRRLYYQSTMIGSTVNPDYGLDLTSGQ